MGCGCSGNNKISLNKKELKFTPKQDCTNKYKELLELDLKCIQIQRDKKGVSNLIREASARIRGWIANLETKCPEDYELNVVRDFIINEYSKYYK